MKASPYVMQETKSESARTIHNHRSALKDLHAHCMGAAIPDQEPPVVTDMALIASAAFICWGLCQPETFEVPKSPVARGPMTRRIIRALRRDLTRRADALERQVANVRSHEADRVLRWIAAQRWLVGALEPLLSPEPPAIEQPAAGSA